VNGMKTVMLLSALTALFMALGYMLSGSGGAVIAPLVALGMNLFTFWNADRIALSMHHAREVDATSAPEFYGFVAERAQRAKLPMLRVYGAQTGRDDERNFCRSQNSIKTWL